MSDGFAAAERVPVWTQPRGCGPTPFTAWGQALREAFVPPEDEFEMPAALVPDTDALREAALAEGYAAGLAAGRAEADGERAALGRLAAGLEALTPEPTQALGATLALAVERLVVQIMGEVEIDRDLLAARACAAAALVGEETRPATLRLHPDDLARLDGVALPVRTEPDGSLAPGALRLETAQGWIEDGPVLRLERLRAQLDRIAASR